MFSAGEIPDWLTGSFLRNGPAGYELGRENYNHFFDGLGLLHRWHINNGSVTYQNKFVRSESFNEAVGRNRVLAGEFGTRSMPDPCKSMYEQFMSYFVSGDQSDNDLVSLFRVGEEFYATSETNYIRKIDPRTLDSAKHK
ncbi:beta,beta-carotene 15,15'-dioxygenase-like, partial [Saccoglossus kowalevskii]|uniref:Beta,beta-carotene 15,15'-monooxygenase-like n=1 Tax=Saccoglossus kowalevskii TaxID=10224 RepID=A0ABM0MLK4_SACKO